MKKHLSTVLFSMVMMTSLFSQPYPIGTLTQTYVDPARNNRNIPTEVFYPATTSGTNVPPADGVFPLVVVGHGFAMTYAAYQFLWEALVPLGYIVVLPKTEGSIIPAPSHSNFGLDLAFLVDYFKASGLNEQSQFYGKVAANAALIGHSMGGGASFLGAANNPTISAVIGFAPAETNPSAIAAAANIAAPTIIFAGSNDCVTPPAQHQIPIYNNVPDGRKMLITINGGGHCFFADYNFFCSIGEGSCSPSPAITRAQQQAITLSILIPFLDFQLKGNFSQWTVFNTQLAAQPVEVVNNWTNLPQLNQIELKSGWNSLSFPTIPIENTFVNLFDEAIENMLHFSDGAFMNFDATNIPDNFFINPNQPYLIKMTMPVTLNFAGHAQTQRSRQLSEGWNLLPVLRNENISVVQLFGKAAENLILKDIAGTNVYWYAMGISTLSTLQAGKSYMIWSPNEFEVIF